MSSLPAEMPKIKSAASGRRRERQQQRGQLKSAGGGDSRERAGIPWVGTSGRTEPGQGRSSGGDSDTGRPSAPRARESRVSPSDERRPRAPPLTFFHGRGGLKSLSSRLLSVTFGAPSWRSYRPLAILFSSLGRSNVFSWEIKAISCFIAGLMFNTGIGQHILKNPLIVNSIIDKVGLEEERERVTGLLILILGISKHRKDS